MGTVKAHLCALDAVHVREFDAALLVPQRRRRVSSALATVRRRRRLRGRCFRRCGARPIRLEEREQASRRCPTQVGEGARIAVFFEVPGARVLQPGALAQTLQTTYKSGYLLYSQFVPQSPPATPRYFSPARVRAPHGLWEDFELAADEGHAYRQLGNAVAVPLVGALAAALAAALEAPADGEPRDAPAAPFSAQPEALAVAIELALRASPPASWAADAGCWAARPRRGDRPRYGGGRRRRAVRRAGGARRGRRRVSRRPRPAVEALAAGGRRAARARRYRRRRRA